MGCGTVGASADQVKLRFKEETAFGVALAANPKFEEISFVSESLAMQTGTTESNEITGDRRLSDISRTSISVGGDVQFELSYQSAAIGVSTGYDLWWEAATQSTAWTAQTQATLAGTAGNGFSIAGGGFATINSTGSLLGGFLANQIIKVKSASNAANNVFCKIVTVASNSLEVRVLSTSADFVSEDSSSAVITQGPYITDGSTCRAFNIEKEFSDLATPAFSLLLGEVLNGFSLSIPTEGIVTGSFTFLGASEASPAPTASTGDGAPRFAEVNDKINSIDNVEIITVDNAKFDVTNMGFTAVNNLRGRNQVGTLGSSSVGSGKFGLTGTVQAFFSDSSFYNKYLAFSEMPITAILKDTIGNAYVFDIPAIKLTSGQRVAGGVNTDVINDMAWTAKKSATEGIVFRMARFDSSDT